MKIAYLITGLGVGGAEVVTIGIANEMVVRGNQVIILYLAPLSDLIPRIDTRIEVYNLKMRKSPYGMVKALLQARRIIKRFDPDILHGNMFHANIFARILHIITKIPRLISTEHNKNIEGSMRMKLYRYTDFLSDLQTNVSKEAIDYFIEQKSFKKQTSVVMYNGIDLSKFKKTDTERCIMRDAYSFSSTDFVFINVGRMTTAKNHKMLIDVFALVVSRAPNARLMIVGGGELEEQLRLQIKELGLEAKVTMAGVQTDVAPFYNCADCFVLSSSWEGFGIVLAEAMACELPVITTDAGGCAEVVNNSMFVVQTHNPEALAEKMFMVYSMSREQRARLGVENLRLATRFDMNTICNQWEALYKNEFTNFELQERL